MNPTQHNEKVLNIKLGSVNCRTIYKSTLIPTTNTFIRYLRSKKINVLLTQETKIPEHSFEEITANFFCRNRISIREQQLQKLQHERDDCILQDQDCCTLTNSQVPIIEDKISELENEVAEVLILKAGKRWMENNEKSAGYLKRTAETRLQKRNIGTLKHPNSNVLCTTTEEKKEAVREFYSVLFSVEDISDECIEAMLEQIDKHFTEEETAELLTDIEYADILKGATRSPNKSNPRLDGLPYEIIHLLIQIPCCRDIVRAVFNEALQKGIFPRSWQETCIILLPKSGDLSDIGNWRPITLINADCKIFTRILNARLMEIVPKIIGEHQIGFMQDRFIGDHGVALKIILEDANKSDALSYIPNKVYTIHTDDTKIKVQLKHSNKVTLF